MKKVNLQDKKGKIRMKKKISYQDKKGDILMKKKMNYQFKKEEILKKRKMHYQDKKDDILTRKKINYQDKKGDILMKKKINYQDNKEEIRKKRKMHYQKNKDEIKERKKMNAGKKTAAAAKLYHKNDITAYKKVLAAQANRKNEKMFFLLQKKFSNEIVRIEKHLTEKRFLTKNVDDGTLTKVKNLENSMLETFNCYESLIHEKYLSVKDEKQDWNLVVNTFDQIFNVYSKGTDFITAEWNKLKTSLDKELKEISLMKEIRIICKGCEKSIIKIDQLNHLSKYKKCFLAYSESELKLRNQWFKWLKDKHLYNLGPLVSKEEKEDFSNKEDSESEQSQE